MVVVGTCTPHSDGRAYTCTCAERFTGRHCELDLNPCASAPCMNGAPCENMYNEYFCRCADGWTGKTCALRGDFDACISSPCGANGVCITGSTGGAYVCNCTKGYSGMHIYTITDYVSDITVGQQCANYPDMVSGPLGLSWLEWGIIGVIGLLVCVFTCCIILFCRQKRHR
jgi:hypothetical protein